MKNILAKLHLVFSQAGTVEKSGFNEYQNYAYSKETDILAALRPMLVKHGLFISHSVTAVKTYPVVSPKGKAETLTEVTVEYTIYEVMSGECLKLTAYGTGADASDKGLYKALTGAHKYFLSKNFCLATNDDVEDDSKESGNKESASKPAVVNTNFETVLMPFGKTKGTPITKMKPEDLDSACFWVRNKCKAPVPQPFLDFAASVDAYIAMMNVNSNSAPVTGDYQTDISY